MWANHVRNLEHHQGKSHLNSAISIGGNLEGPSPSVSEAGSGDGESRSRKESISVAISVPQSKYEYEAVQPAIIETPQLRDMGEATPPLEWIGLNRERLPNLTHQVSPYRI